MRPCREPTPIERGSRGAAAAGNRRGNRYPARMADEDAAPVSAGAAHLRMLERARRLAPEPAAGHPLADLAAGASDAAVAAARGLPPATVRGLRSFYDQLGAGRRVCDGTACRFGGGEALARRLARDGAVGTVRCLGHCYAAPRWPAARAASTAARARARARGYSARM